MNKPRRADPTTNGSAVDFKKARRIKATLAKSVPDDLPPHSIEAEQGVLGCIMLSPLDSLDECVKRLESPDAFYDLRHRTIYETFLDRASKAKGLDLITLQQSLKDRRLLEGIGGLSYLASLPDAVPSAANLSYYLEIVREKYAVRKLVATCTEIVCKCYAHEGDADKLFDEVSRELSDASIQPSSRRGELKLWRVNDLAHYTPDVSLALVGDNEIRKGYEGVTLIAGPGSSGKSLAVSSLALAGAIGKGSWMGRKVHRQFRTLIIQAENGATRLKKEMAAIQAAHPGIDLNDWIIISDPPEGGIPFHKAEFRASVRRHVEQLKPDAVIIDPWSHVAVEDAAKDVVDKIAEIRSCFPPGDQCPALVIVAHTKKPRAEDVKRGRALAYLISGSVALVNTARCVFMLLPWSEEVTDDRIYWSCCKLNDGAMYPPSVWKRRFGTFFEHDAETDPTQWGEEVDANEERRSVTREMLATVFKEQKRPGMKRGELVRFLVERFDLAESTVWRSLKADGYAMEWLDMVAGVVALKKGTK